MRVLIASTPLQGHVTPLVEVTRALRGRRHEVKFLTGSRFSHTVQQAGATHVSLPAEADYDDRDLNASFPSRRHHTRLGKVNFDIEHLLARPLPSQASALGKLVGEWVPDVVMVDTTFYGGIVWHLAQRDPPLAVANITYLTVAGKGVPPAGPGFLPLPGRFGERRDEAVRRATERLIARRGLRFLDGSVRSVLGRPVPGILFDGQALADRLFVLTVPSFEYPRVDLPANVRFVGPVLPGSTAALLGGRDPSVFDRPDWWDDLDNRRPVVHVTQGTFDNADLGKLIAPTMTALADEEVLVVATTGGAPPSSIPCRLPGNARVAKFLPYDQLLPRTDVMVTNGGYGGVQCALAAGVPLLVAGDGEDKPEIAARVKWSGAGLRLRSGRPGPRALHRSVLRLLNEPSFRVRADAIRAEMSNYGGAEAIADGLEELATR